MTKEHTYQDLDLFFEQFKNMPEYITLEQVTQFIQHPKPSSSFQLKGSTFKLWSILITAASVIAISTILYFSLSGSSNQAQEQSIFHEKSVPPAVTNPVVKTDSSESESQEITHTTHIVQTNPDADEFVSYGETESDKNNGFKALNSQNQDILDTLIEIEEKQIFYIVEDSQTFNGGEPFVESLKNQKLDLVDEPIDGNPYIIDDLSLDELRNLGLDIQHYAVFYRNTFPETDYYFISANKKIYNLSRIAPSLNWAEPERVNQDSFILNTDTLPDETSFCIFIMTEWHLPGQSPESTKHWFNSIEKNYYPVYISTLKGSVSGIKPLQEFDQSSDTLVPIIIPFSRLNCNQKKDLIFWFHATENFYQDLPERYRQLQSHILNRKRLKVTYPDRKLVKYDFENWISNRMFPPNEVIDGQNFIMELALDEQEKIGLFRDKENETKFEYCYIAPWGHFSWAGAKMTWLNTPNIKGRDSIYFTNFDNVFNADFYPDFITDTLGNDISSSTTGKILQSSLIENDVLIPIKNSDRIYWFTQSDSLWTLLPDRYQYLHDTYQRILFSKSIYPETDLVSYFKEVRNHVNMNIEVLDLRYDELKDLGFRIYKDSMTSFSSVINNEWVQYKAIKPPFYSLIIKEEYDEKTLEIFFKGLTYVVNENNKEWQKENNGLDYDALLKGSLQGFQFLMITDELGHELQQFHSIAREIYLSGKESKYLIPVRVPLDKYFSEYSETKIFWFTPTEAFFDRLPDRIKKNLRQDFYSLTGNLESSSCTYFEECRSTLKLDKFKIYPNPAKESITISFNASEEVSGNIYLLDIKGSILKTFESIANITNGSNEFHYTLDDIQPGIYLVAVQSENGIKTGRLIVSE